ncbi:helix-turn-helix domain-containing protein [Thermodesulfobacteriota bacterium]
MATKADKDLSTVEVARILDMCPDDVATLSRKGFLRDRKRGRQWRFAKRGVMYFGRKR